MEFKENKDNYYTKELNDVDRYLLRIIKRYFDLEEINSAASINAIISEAMSRYKFEINYQNAGVNTINNKFGIANINISDLNGEKKFEKLTAFNKDFGNTNNTICEGNDKRLFNKRKPKEHHHKISDVENLKEDIDNIKKELVKYVYHIHFNANILNRLKYNGTNTQIDLVKLESLGSIVNSLLNTLNKKMYHITDLYNSNKEIIDELVNQIYYFMEKIYNYINSSNENTNKLLINYINEKINKIQTIKEDIENNYLDSLDLSKILDAINNSLLISTTQEIDISKELNTQNNIDTKDFYNTSSMIGIYEDIIKNYSNKSGWKCSDSLSYNQDKEEYIILLSDNEYQSYVHEVTINNINDGITSVILASNNIGDYLYVLSLNITQDKMSVIFGYQMWYQEELAYDDTFNQYNWVNNKIKLKIQRNGYSFKIYRSDINSDIINSIPCIEFTLKDSYKHMIQDKSKFGYGCYLQPNSKFSEIKFTSYENIILDDIISLEQDIDLSKMAIAYNSDSVEIEPELVYNNTRTKLPFITNDFVVNSERINNKLFIKIYPLKSNVIMPSEFSSSKIIYNIYLKTNIT